MKLASFEHDGQTGFGIVEGPSIVDMTGAVEGILTLQDLVEQGGAARLGTAGKGKRLSLDEITLLPPIAKPEKILCIGVNYGNRNAEYKDGSDLPKYPSLFMRSSSSFVGHGMPLERPSVSEQLDYEGEIAIVIGKEGRHISREAAAEHIFGLTICNEGSVRDWLYHGKFNVTQGKNFDRSGSLGPWIVTRDECDPMSEIALETRVNGEVRQSDTTANLMFPFDYLISYLSTFTTLRPGDIISTGTPIGAGVRQDPPVWLKPGDVVEIEVAGIGALTNTIRDEDPSNA